MKQSDIFARSFNQHDKRRYGYGALVGCFVVTWYLCSVFKPYFGPLYVYFETKETGPICDRFRRSDICKMSGDVRIQGKFSTIFVSTSNFTNATWTLKPYAHKEDEAAMKSITTFTIKSIEEQAEEDEASMKSITTFTIKSIEEQAETLPKCSQTHKVAAIVFSVGGFGGNYYHAFTDVIIPLYATSREFNGEVKFLVSNDHSQWTSKFRDILSKLSRYEIIDIDNEIEVHCFPSMIVGLKKDDQKELNMNPMKDFSKFLRSSYSLKRSTAINMTNNSSKRPRLLIVSRQETRVVTNVKDVVRVAQDIGFKVIVSEMNANLTNISRLVNSVDVMMGVHGAGLTNIVFLPENSVFIQVVPLGKMDWIANTCFGEPSKGMGLKYLEYKISEGESTLIEQYPRNHQAFMDPYTIQKKGWEAYKSIYMDKQNVKIDVVRFKETLSKAFELLH